jgi:hypothetical protein
MKADLKFVALVAAGVILAGYVMDKLAGRIAPLKEAQAGFND